MNSAFGTPFGSQVLSTMLIIVVMFIFADRHTVVCILHFKNEQFGAHSSVRSDEHYAVHTPM